MSKQNPFHPENYMHPDYGPEYRSLGTGVQRYRRMARAAGSVATMDAELRREYGAVVCAAILKQQRSELQRELPSHNVDCPSGTNHNDGAKIIKAVRNRMRGQLLRCPSRIAGLDDDKVKELYEEAMKAKRERASLPWLEKSEPERAVLRNEVIAKRKTVPTTIDEYFKVNGIYARFYAPTSRKGFVVIQCPPIGGQKSMAAVIAQRQLKGKWSAADHGYLVPPDAVERFKAIATSL